MAKYIRITITPEMEESLKVLREYTSGTLNTTELIKMALGMLAHRAKIEMEQQQKLAAEGKKIVLGLDDC